MPLGEKPFLKTLILRVPAKSGGERGEGFSVICQDRWPWPPVA